MLTVCAIILDYFGSSKTIACLTSLIDQGLDSVMVVDNSGDQEANIQLEEALTEFRQREPPFQVYQIVNPQNLGYAAGVNNALRWLEENKQHSYYLLINNDAEATPGMLQQLLKYMQEHDRTALIAPVIETGHKKQIKGYWYQRFSGLLFSSHLVGTFLYLTGCCLLVDRRIVGNGLLDEDFFMYGEDVALSWRLRLSGWDAACSNHAVVRHEGTGSSRQGGFFYEYHMVRGHLMLARKIAMHQWQISFFYFGRLVTISTRAIVRAIRFRSFVPIAASLCALRRHNDSITWRKCSD